MACKAGRNDEINARQTYNEKPTFEQNREINEGNNGRDSRTEKRNTSPKKRN